MSDKYGGGHFPLAGVEKARDQPQLLLTVLNGKP